MSDDVPRKKTSPLRLTLAVVAASGAIGVAALQYHRLENMGAELGGAVERVPNVIDTDDGRQLLWASGPHDAEKGEWFDVTGSPIGRDEYQFGIGKDSIPAIDFPLFAPIGDAERLRRDYVITDDSEVIGFVHNGEAKAYPIAIMNRHELVNDMVGGKPVTVGW